MAKVTVLEDVIQCIDNQLTNGDYTIDNLLGRERANWCVLAIYQTNDVTRGYGQDWRVYVNENEIQREVKVSVISSPNRISVILDNQASYYQDNYDVCGYEDLEEDVKSILTMMQAAFDRIESR